MNVIRRSMRRRMERLRGEAQLLAMAMAVCFAGFLSALPREMARVPDEARLAAVGWLFTGAMFFGPLMLIGLAALSRLVSQAFGGQGSWQHARLALFWALVLSLPLLLLGNLGSGWIAFFALCGMLVIWSQTLSEAEEFSRSWTVLAAMVVVPFGMLVAAF